MFSSISPGSASIVIFVLAAMSTGAIADGKEDHFVTPLSGQRFGKEIHGGSSDWVVVFCDDLAQPCTHMMESFRKLTVIWMATGLFSGVHFGEVNCAEDRRLCEMEGIATFPTAVHYRRGMRLAPWTVESE